MCFVLQSSCCCCCYVCIFQKQSNAATASSTPRHTPNSVDAVARTFAALSFLDVPSKILRLVYLHFPRVCAVCAKRTTQRRRQETPFSGCEALARACHALHNTNANTLCGVQRQLVQCWLADWETMPVFFLSTMGKVRILSDYYIIKKNYINIKWTQCLELNINMLPTINVLKYPISTSTRNVYRCYLSDAKHQFTAIATAKFQKSNIIGCVIKKTFLCWLISSDLIGWMSWV